MNIKSKLIHVFRCLIRKCLGEANEQIVFKFREKANYLQSIYDASKASRGLGSGELENIIHFLRRDFLLCKLAFGDVANFERKTGPFADLLGC